MDVLLQILEIVPTLLKPLKAVQAIHIDKTLECLPVLSHDLHPDNKSISPKYLWQTQS